MISASSYVSNRCANEKTGNHHFVERHFARPTGNFTHLAGDPFGGIPGNADPRLANRAYLAADRGLCGKARMAKVARHSHQRGNLVWFSCSGWDADRAHPRPP